MSVQKDCYATLKRINLKLHHCGKVELAVRSGYGKYGVDASDTNANVSPLLPIRVLLLWLEAFESGLDYATDESKVTL